MLHDIHVFLYAHRWAVLVVTAIVVAIYVRILLAHLRAPARDERRIPPPRPVGKPSAKFAETVRAEDIPRPEVSVASQLAKSRAQTNRMAPVTVGDPAAKAAEADDAAMSDLFSGLDDGGAKQAPTARTQEPKSDSQRRGITETGAIRRVGRMEELGFHHSIDSDPPKPGIAPEPAPSAIGDGTTRSEAKPAAAAELDAILARIDQVLSQDGKKTEVADAPGPAPAAKADARTRPTEMMPPSAQPADPRTKQTQVLSPPEGEAKDANAKKAPPLWARADAFDEDADKAEAKKPDAGTQLGLFDDKK